MAPYHPAMPSCACVVREDRKRLYFQQVPIYRFILTLMGGTHTLDSEFPTKLLVSIYHKKSPGTKLFQYLDMDGRRIEELGMDF